MHIIKYSAQWLFCDWSISLKCFHTHETKDTVRNDFMLSKENKKQWEEVRVELY